MGIFFFEYLCSVLKLETTPFYFNRLERIFARCVSPVILKIVFIVFLVKMTGIIGL